MSLIRYQFPELSHWSSFDRLAAVRDEFDRLFDFSFPSRDSGLISGWSPALDVFEDNDNLVVKVELPGLNKDEINLALHDGALTVSGERKHERDVKESGAFRSERYFGKFQRSVTLPTAVDASRVSADYKDGVLTVQLPKAEEAKPRQIAINVS